MRIMISLPQLRHSFAAAFGAIVLVILMAGFVVPASVIVCGPSRVYVMLARSIDARSLPGSETDLSITVKEDGTLVMGNVIVPVAQFEAELTEISRRTPGRRLVVRSDKRSPFGATRVVVRSAQSLGFRNVVIETGIYSVADAWHR
jgi:biopolymer transport protein ExbD